jgi:superfamily II DNA or RNA helicase
VKTLTTIQKEIKSALTNQIVIDSGNGFGPESVKTWFYILINNKTQQHFFGQSKFSRKDKRHNDDVYTKVLGAWAADGYDTYWIGISQEGTHLDKQCHKKVKKLGKDKCWWNESGKGSNEVFLLYGLNKDQIINTWTNIVKETFGEAKVEKKPSLKLRKYQKEFLLKINSMWENWKEFLLFAKCRAGKSIMALYHVLEKGYKVTLIVSRHTSPVQSWRDDVKKYADYDDLVFIDLAVKNWQDQLEYWLNTDKQIVLWSTIQAENRWNKIPCDVDLIIYDEAHIGYGSTQWNTMHKSLDKKFNCRVLYVTGTAYDIEENFSVNKFVYSYFEEQRDKKLGLNNAPSMELILVKYSLNEEYRKIYGDCPDAMKNLFSLNDDKTDFREPALVRGFYSEHFGRQRHLRSDQRLLKKAKHIYMCLPSVDACHLSAKYLLSTDFAPLVVTGDTKEDVDSIKKHIADNPQGTIILTVRANVLGVTIPEIDTVINCSEGESLNFWSQFAFRGGSSDENWVVIDFCPERCLQSLRKLYLSACDNDPSIAEYEFSEFFAAITEWIDGYEIMTPERIAEILASDVESSCNLMSSFVSCLDFDKLRHFDIDLDLDSSNQNNTKSEVINKTDGANGKSNKTRVNENPVEKEFDIVLDKKVKTVKAILERVPLTMFHMIRNNQTPNSIQSVIKSEHYVYNTMDDKKFLEELLNQKIGDVRSLNCRVSQVAIGIQHQITKDECTTLEKLSCSRQSQKSMSVNLVDKLLDGVF